jgi:hypothetical protein
VGDAAAGQRVPAGEVGHVADVFGPHDARTVNGHVREDAVQVEVLLRVRVDEVVEVVAGDCQDGLAVHLRIVQAVEEVDAPGAGRRQADTKPAGVLGVGASHERCRLLVPHLDEADLVLSLS